MIGSVTDEGMLDAPKPRTARAAVNLPGAGFNRGNRKEQRKVAPSALFAARIDPPCAMTIERLMANPSPRPSSRNVTNGSKTRSS